MIMSTSHPGGYPLVFDQPHLEMVGWPRAAQALRHDGSVEGGQF
jgi:hypothetical protein